jgi:hypothetical protein
MMPNTEENIKTKLVIDILTCVLCGHVHKIEVDTTDALQVSKDSFINVHREMCDGEIKDGH